MTAKRLGMLGATVLLAGGGLLGTAIAASATTPTLTFAPNSDIGDAGQGILITASGFSPKTKGGLSECPIVTGEPTILDVSTGQQEPVGCQAFTAIKTNSKGHLPNPTGYGIQAGFNGPPDSQTKDSAGGDANADAANYPCPPTAAQQAAGGSCVILYTDTLGESAQQTIAFNFNSTTTTTAPPVVGCTPKSATVTTGGATVTVDPATCLVGNQPVKVTGSGLKGGSLGTLLECNTKTPQPTVYVNLATKAVPVSCSTVTKYLVTTGGDGTLPTTTFTIIVGVTGPPADASGESPAGTGTAPNASTDSPAQAVTDAASFPCDNTTPDGTCTLTFGDLAGDQVSVPLAFGSGPALAPPPTKSGTGSTPTAKAAATKASTGKLAFTGPGTGLWVMGVLGMALILLGGSLLVLVDAPRRLLTLAAHRGHRSEPTP
jgi:hypothetical protein